MSIYSASELDSSFAGLDSTSASTSRFTVMGVPADKMARGWRAIIEEGDYLKISVKGGDYLREATNRGTAIIRENTVKASLVFSNYYLRALFLHWKRFMFCFPRRRFNIKFHVFLLRAFLCLRVVVFARLYKTPRYRKKVRAKTISSKIFLVGFFFFFFWRGGGGGGYLVAN